MSAGGASLAVGVNIHDRRAFASLINLFDGALFFQEEFLDSIVHLRYLKVSFTHDLADLVKGQLTEVLLVVLVVAKTTTRVLGPGQT